MAEASIPVVDRATVGDVELCYDLRGAPSDPVVLLVSGLGSPLVGWDDDFCDLVTAEGFGVLRFDNRDAGRSTTIDRPAGGPPTAAPADGRPPGPAPYTLDDMADDAAGLLDVLGVDAAHVVGRSMGGMIAQTLACRHPARVLSLCSIMSTTGAPGVGRPTDEALAVVMRPAPDDRAGFVRAELDNARVIGSRGALADESWRRRHEERIFDHGVNPEGRARQVRAIVASGDRTAALGGIGVPTLVVHGDADTLVPPDGGQATARAVPGARLVVIPDMGHEVPPGTWPEIVAAIVANARRAAPGGRPVGDAPAGGAAR